MHLSRMALLLSFAAFNSLWICASHNVLAADKPVKKTAPTVAEALKVFDPEKLPLLESEEPTGIQRVGGFSYQAKSDPQTAYKFYQDVLTKLKWKELPNSYVTDMTCSGTFSKDGYLLTVSTTPLGEKGQVLVSFHNNSKLDLKKLPVPKEAKPFYSLPTVEAYLTKKDRDETAAEVTQRLVALGWEPYGTAGDQIFFRQNAVRLSANVMTAPAQDNQTVISYSADQLSAEIPAPAKTVLLQYSDLTKHLLFDSDVEPADEAFASMHTFYNESLATAGWKPTTEKPIVTGPKHMVIYRNPAKDMLTLEMFDFDGRLRVEVNHQSAAEVAAIDAQIDAKIAAKKKEEAEKKSKPQPKPGTLSVTLPADAKNIEADASEIKFTVGQGKGKSFVEALMKKLKADGWKEQTATLDAMVGLVLLEKGDQDLRLMYLETGVLPTEVTIAADGIELEQAKAKK